MFPCSTRSFQQIHLFYTTAILLVLSTFNGSKNATLKLLNARCGNVFVTFIVYVFLQNLWRGEIPYTSGRQLYLKLWGEPLGQHISFKVCPSSISSNSILVKVFFTAIDTIILVQ